MAQQHLDPTDPTAVPADAVAGYLRAQATEFLRALRTHRETGGGVASGAEESTDAALALRRSARRISGTLHTFRPLLDTDWSESLRPELAWLSGTLGREHAYAARLTRLVTALNRLSGATPFPAQSAMPTRATAAGGLATTSGVRSAGGRAGAAASTTGGRSTAASAVGSRSAGAERLPTA
ncbi:CHAD domain-containing protein, partial [Streptomyces scabiei]|uniref:CHAD domain-containing protein n=1 Tax=Streptomyces scabiei TaxID=1930 RepID=UPI0015C5166A